MNKGSVCVRAGRLSKQELGGVLGLTSEGKDFPEPLCKTTAAPSDRPSDRPSDGRCPAPPGHLLVPPEANWQPEKAQAAPTVWLRR